MTIFLKSISIWLQFGGSVITVLSGLGFGFLEYYKLTPNKKTFALIACLGGLLSALGAYYSGKDTDDKTKTIIEQGRKIDSLSVVNVILSRSNSTKLDQSLLQLDSIIGNSIFTLGKLEGQSNKLSTVYLKAKEIQDYNTGGNSFAVVENIFLPANENFLSFFVSNHGDYPLYNLKISIDEKEKKYLKRQNFFKSFDEVLKPSTYTYNLPMLKPDDGWVRLEDIRLPTKDSINFGVSCKAQNGVVHQTIIAMKIIPSQDWTFATQVKRGEKVVYEKIDSDFPYVRENIKWEIDFGIPIGFPIPDSILDKFYPIKN